MIIKAVLNKHKLHAGDIQYQHQFRYNVCHHNAVMATAVTMVIASTNFSSHPTARQSQPEQKGAPNMEIWI